MFQTRLFSAGGSPRYDNYYGSDGFIELKFIYNFLDK